MTAPTYPKPAVRNAWADTAVATLDIVDPGNSVVTQGWLQTSQPPPRQTFNWLLNWSAGAVRYFMQRGVSSWDVLETYSAGGTVYFNGWLYQSLVNNNTGNSPITALGLNASWTPLNGYAYVSSDPSVASNIHNLINYVTNTSLTSTLAAFVTQASLTSQLAAYVTQTSLTSQLSAYVTIASLNATLASFLTIASAAVTYLTIATANSTFAKLISPGFSGVPTAPTAASGTTTNQLATTQFSVGTFSTGNPNFMKLPSGLIIQWGVTGPSSGGPALVSFTIAFPTQCGSITATAFPSNGTISTSDPRNSNTGFTLTNGAAGDFTSWMAIGH